MGSRGLLVGVVGQATVPHPRNRVPLVGRGGVAGVVGVGIGLVVVVVVGLLGGKHPKGAKHPKCPKSPKRGKLQKKFKKIKKFFWGKNRGIWAGWGAQNACGGVG